MTLTAVTLADTTTGFGVQTPQQALAYRHHNNHKNHNNSIKVDQQINQLNNCTGAPQDTMDNGAAAQAMGSSGTVCLNSGDNSADIH